MPQLLFSSLLIAIVITAGSTSARAADPQINILAERDSMLNDLHHSNEMEIEMGKLAKTNGRSDAIKEFGDTLVTDHTDADKKVIELAKSQNIRLENSGMRMNAQENKMMRKLESLHGSAFDLAFAEAMVTDHQKDIEKLKTALITLSGTPAGDLATAILPVIQKHEDIAIDLVAKLNVSGNQKS